MALTTSTSTVIIRVIQKFEKISNRHPPAIFFDLKVTERAIKHRISQ